MENFVFQMKNELTNSEFSIDELWISNEEFSIPNGDLKFILTYSAFQMGNLSFSRLVLNWKQNIGISIEKVLDVNWWDLLSNGKSQYQFTIDFDLVWRLLKSKYFLNYTWEWCRPLNDKPFTPYPKLRQYFISQLSYTLRSVSRMHCHNTLVCDNSEIICTQMFFHLFKIGKSLNVNHTIC